MSCALNPAAPPPPSAIGNRTFLQSLRFSRLLVPGRPEVLLARPAEGQAGASVAETPPCFSGTPRRPSKDGFSVPGLKRLSQLSKPPGLEGPGSWRWGLCDLGCTCAERGWLPGSWGFWPWGTPAQPVFLGNSSPSFHNDTLATVSQSVLPPPGALGCEPGPEGCYYRPILQMTGGGRGASRQDPGLGHRWLCTPFLSPPASSS